jgi:hypothetical protein
MKRNVMFLLCLIFSMSVIPVAGAQTSPQVSSVLYRWLDKFEKHTISPGVQKPKQQAEQSAPLGGSPVFITGMEARGTAASQLEEPPILVENSNEPVEPGEGLGCYYHRSYYSHLPLFKNGSYHLPGSLAVAEPAQVLPQETPSAPLRVPR